MGNQDRFRKMEYRKNVYCCLHESMDMMTFDVKKYIRKSVTLFGVFLFFKDIYKCPFKLWTGLDCPGCGLTRALLSVLVLDVGSAFDYHPLFWLIGIEIVYVVFFRKKRINKRIELCVGIFTVALLAIVWIYKIFML